MEQPYLVKPSLSALPPGLRFIPLDNGAIARLDSAYPVVARLAAGDDGWSVSLIGASFDTQPSPVARGLSTTRGSASGGGDRPADRPGAGSARQLPLSAPGDRAQPAGTATKRRASRRSGTAGYLTSAVPTRWSRSTWMPSCGYLDATFPHLVNLAQHRPHFDPARGRTTDPNEHTIEVLAGLNTSELADEDARLARMTIVYHDIGKGLDAYDPRHPLESARLAAPLLAYHGLTPGQQATVLLQIREHDLLGILSRGRMARRRSH